MTWIWLKQTNEIKISVFLSKYRHQYLYNKDYNIAYIDKLKMQDANNFEKHLQINIKMKIKQYDILR